MRKTNFNKFLECARQPVVDKREAFALGNKIVDKNIDKNQSQALNVAIALAGIGRFDDEFKDEAIISAYIALELMEEVEPDSYGIDGVCYYSCKEDARAWMQYLVGTALVCEEQNRLEGIELLKEAIAAESGVRNLSTAFDALGYGYFAEAMDMGARRLLLISEKTQPVSYEAFTLWQKEAGLAELAIEAYGRAYELCDDAGGEFQKAIAENLEMLRKMFPDSEAMRRGGSKMLISKLIGFAAFCFESIGEEPPSKVALVRLLGEYEEGIAEDEGYIETSDEEALELEFLEG